MSGRRLLIVHASADLYGSDRACLAIARAATAHYEVHVVVPWRGPLVERLEAAGATTHVFDPLVLRKSELRGLSGLITPLRWVRAAVRLERFARRGRFDVVHSNCVTTIGGRLLARRFKAPHVWHVHELFADDAVARFVFEHLLRGADCIVAASSSVADQFRSSELRARCVVAHTGADVPDTVARIQPLQRAPARLVCVGRLNAWKGQDDLIDAVALLRDEGVEVHLDLVGDVYAHEHHFRDRLVARVRALDLDARVSFLGERADALELMGAADIVVIPSASPEPFGMVVVEAMAL
ncbi:MAG TPA: glycosyltransferase, partial [Gaiellaceae bacterium]|nr:glycosyltransferase [Gaiellaceae bacterium]